MPGPVLAWSGGKDAAYALSVLRSDDDPPVELFTTINRAYDRSTMHGVRRELYEQQADALDIPINLVSLPPNPSNDAYEEAMAEELERYRDRGIRRTVFGDLHLEDVRAYREEQLEDTGIDGEWPLWGTDTSEFAETVIDAGIDAVLVAADASVLDRSFVGRPYDEELLEDLPDDVDPAGESGEFHTFVRDGPGFSRSVRVETAETVTRDVQGSEFHYLDLVPAEDGYG